MKVLPPTIWNKKAWSEIVAFHNRLKWVFIGLERSNHTYSCVVLLLVGCALKCLI
jgi:hypothetical protein